MPYLSSSLPAWLPPEGAGLWNVPCGRRFDAVRVAAVDGVRVIGRLREGSGPVIEDQAAGSLCWLVAPGQAIEWELAGVEVLGVGKLLVVPPVDFTRGPALRWRVGPFGDCLTRAGRLYAALTGVRRRG